MSEPENHTLRLLREFREEFREFRTRTEENFVDLKARIDGLNLTLAGEIATNRYTAGGVERRLADIEKRLSALEQQQ